MKSLDTACTIADVQIIAPFPVPYATARTLLVDFLAYNNVHLPPKPDKDALLEGIAEYGELKRLYPHKDDSKVGYYLDNYPA